MNRVYLVCDKCKTGEHILTHSSFWENCHPKHMGLIDFLLNHFDKGCGLNNFKMIDEAHHPEDEYALHSEDDDLEDEWAEKDDEDGKDDN